MALSYTATFRPEKRKNDGIVISENVPLMLDLSCRGRIWYNTGIRLQNIDDFNTKTQKLDSGKQAKKNKSLQSAKVINNELTGISGRINTAFNNAVALNIDITAKYLIDQLRILSSDTKVIKGEKDDFITAFNKYIDWSKKYVIGEGRKKHYDVVLGMLERFFRVYGYNVTPDQFTAQMLIEFQTFLSEEHTLLEKYPVIYKDMTPRNIPGKRTQNTIASKLKILKPVFKYWEQKDIILVNPFNKLANVEKKSMMTQSYDEAVCLSLKELQIIIQKPVPTHLERVRDCFLLQCAVGMRVEDFNSLRWNNVNTEHGFYHIHYVPKKTSRDGDLKPIDTPLVKFASDIILKYKDNLPGFLAPHYEGNVSGKFGYNYYIKELLKHYGINRGVVARIDGELKTVPISTVASSKLARKTNVDILAKVELNKYISGMHSIGSKAVEHYTNLNIEEKFQIYCQAFQQPTYSL